MVKKTLDDLKLLDKKVLMRVDFNVPIENGIVKPNNRIQESLPSIKKIIDQGGKLILFSHLGRIKNHADLEKYNLAPVAEQLAKLLKIPVMFINKTRGKELETAIDNLKQGQVLLVQNTRYEDLNNRAESDNNPELGAYWASLGEVFINDAFGMCHRAHASNVGIATYSKVSAIGYLVEKELRMLSKGLDHPNHPFVAIVGGAKVVDKLALINNLLQKADRVIITGGMATTFTKALGYSIGKSLVDNDFLPQAKKLLKDYHDKIVLPVDFAISKNFENSPRQEIDNLDIPENYMSLDVGQQTINLYAKVLKGAKTVIWNGPAGVSEFSNYEQGTVAIAKIIAEQKDIFSIIGGGDSAAAAIKLGFKDKFTHISTGGGASLTYMEGKTLPGIEVIQNL